MQQLLQFSFCPRASLLGRRTLNLIPLPGLGQGAHGGLELQSCGTLAISWLYWATGKGYKHFVFPQAMPPLWKEKEQASENVEGRRNPRRYLYQTSLKKIQNQSPESYSALPRSHSRAMGRVCLDSFHIYAQLSQSTFGEAKRMQIVQGSAYFATILGKLDNPQ